MDGSARTRFESWKEIASYLKTSVRTVQRWEKDERLPVHRHAHARQDTVYAYRDEIDHWRSDRDRHGTQRHLALVRDRIPAGRARERCVLHAACRISRSLLGPFLRREEELRILQESLKAFEQAASESCV